MKKAIVGLALLVAIFSIVGLALRTDNPSQTASVSAYRTNETRSPGEKRSPGTHDHVTSSKVPAYYAAAPAVESLAPTLPAELFTGNERLAYQAAKEIPQTLAQLPCYCHCDSSIGHKSLHSCFESEHGENCGTCIGEALMAYQLEKRGKLGAAEIRRRIIEAYGSQSSD